MNRQTTTSLSLCSPPFNFPVSKFLLAVCTCNDTSSKNGCYGRGNGTRGRRGQREDTAEEEVTVRISLSRFVPHSVALSRVLSRSRCASELLSSLDCRLMFFWKTRSRQKIDQRSTLQRVLLRYFEYIYIYIYV